jgi:hypothetical protein
VVRCSCNVFACVCVADKDKYDKYAAAQEMSRSQDSGEDRRRESNGHKSDRHRDGDRKDHSRHHRHRDRDGDSDRDSSRHRHGHSDTESRRSDDDPRLSSASDSRSAKKHRATDDYDDDRLNSKRSRVDTASALTVSWLRPLLRVRIIDDKYRGGKYYKQKVRNDCKNNNNNYDNSDNGNNNNKNYNYNYNNNSINSDNDNNKNLWSNCA